MTDEQMNELVASLLRFVKDATENPHNHSSAEIEALPEIAGVLVNTYRVRLGTY